MLILQTGLFFLALFLTLFSLSGYGQLIKTDTKKNFLEQILFGVIVITFIITFAHFFINISFIVSIFILIFGLLIFFAKKEYEIKNLKFSIKYLIILFLLLPIFINQKYHEDFGYYHLPYIIATVNEKIIFGLANTNIAFNHNSIWLNTMSIFYFAKNNFDYINLPSFLIYAFFIIFFIREYLKSKKKLFSNYFILISIFYLIIKYTRISEYGNDLPGLIFSILSIFYFLKFFETNITKEKTFSYFCCFVFAAFSVLIKLSGIPILLLPIFLLIKNFQILKKKIFNLNSLFIYSLALIFIIQQFIYTSCFVFPSNFTCIETKWFSHDFLLLKKNLELINKSYSISELEFTKTDYLENFNWFPYWYSRNISEILENFLTIILPIILLISLSPKSKKNSEQLFMNKGYLILFTFISFIFWFNFSPVYRFAVPYFLSLVFILSVNFFEKKDISKKIFLLLISLSLLFSFSKNILRIKDKDLLFFGIEKINNKFYQDKQSNNQFININRPDIENNTNGWQGRLCWDIPFLCTYNEISVEKKYRYLFINKLKKSK